MEFTDTHGEKHHLKVDKDPRQMRAFSFPQLPDGFLGFKCTECDVEFYIRRKDAIKYLVHPTKQPMKTDGKMFYKSGGEWHLVFTLIS